MCKCKNKLYVHRHMLCVHKHNCLRCIPTPATSSVSTNTSCMSTDTIPGSTLNVEEIGLLDRIFFLETPKNIQVAILRVVLGKNGFHFPKIFQETLKAAKSEFYTPKITTSIHTTLLWKCSPPSPRYYAFIN